MFITKAIDLAMHTFCEQQSDTKGHLGEDGDHIRWCKWRGKVWREEPRATADEVDNASRRQADTYPLREKTRSSHEYPSCQAIDPKEHEPKS